MRKTAGRRGAQSIQPTLTGMEWDTAISTGNEDGVLVKEVLTGIRVSLTEDELLELGVASGRALEWDRARYSETFENVELEMDGGMGDGA